MKKSLTCIVCPMGCQLEIEMKDSAVVSVTGNTCKRGVAYAETECTDPRRIITTTVKTEEGYIIPVKTSEAVPKDMMFECMKVINNLRVKCDKEYGIGSVVLENILDTGADVVVCSNTFGG